MENHLTSFAPEIGSTPGEKRQVTLFQTLGGRMLSEYFLQCFPHRPPWLQKGQNERDDLTPVEIEFRQIVYATDFTLPSLTAAS
jgi:hypothetical protein